MNENLTPQIVAALLQDGTCKLTKAQMEAVVAPAVAALGKKYRFLGVAQPNTAPGSIPVPTLFVAVADGTYPSFSNQSVDGGDIAFFTSDDGGAWAMTLIVSGGAGYVKKSDIVTSVSGSSTNKQVPGAKLLYDNYVQKSDVATLVPKPIVLTDLPTAAMTTQAELDAIGLTTAEMTAAAQGLRTGVVCLGKFYGIDMANADEFAFSRKSYSGTEMDALWAAYIHHAEGHVSVDIAQI